MRRFATPILLFAALALASAAACTSVTGTTPACVDDVGPNGIKVGVENGCTGYATCAENPSNPAVCCVDGAGKPFTGNQLELCLFTYGKGPPPTSAATGGSTGAGGGGGAGGK